ncbi:hypothetical protein D3C80_1201150 [compost metagenome]
MILGRQNTDARRGFCHAVALNETGLGKCLTGTVEQGWRDHRCAIGDLPKRTQVERRHGRIGLARIEQHLDHGWGQQGVTGLFLADHRQRFFCLERWQYHMGATDDVQCNHCRQISQMEHRHSMQITGVAAKFGLVDHSQGGKTDVVVA